MRDHCTCIPCPTCEGTGNVWFSMTGDYLGKNRCDDMDELEKCYDCDGERIIELCDYCREMQEREEMEL